MSMSGQFFSIPKGTPGYGAVGKMATSKGWAKSGKMYKMPKNCSPNIGGVVTPDNPSSSIMARHDFNRSESGKIQKQVLRRAGTNP